MHVWEKVIFEKIYGKGKNSEGKKYQNSVKCWMENSLQIKLESVALRWIRMTLYPGFRASFLLAGGL